jgi:hypothetical protein
MIGWECKLEIRPFLSNYNCYDSSIWSAQQQAGSQHAHGQEVSYEQSWNSPPVSYPLREVANLPQTEPQISQNYFVSHHV